MGDWMVYVTAGTAPVTGEDELDRLLDALLEQPGALSASVAGGDEPSALVTVEAATAHDARCAGERVVAAALRALGASPEGVHAAGLYDRDGRFVPV